MDRPSDPPSVLVRKFQDAFPIACGLWLTAAIVVSILVIHNPAKRTVTDVYYNASQSWWTGQPLYDNSIDGFLYFPQCAILYTPFELLATPAGDVLWRVFSLALFCHGLWRLCRLLSPGNAKGIFALASLLAIAPAMGSLRNGQANLLLAALMLQTTAELMQSRWWLATLWLTLGLGIKPIMIVMFPLAVVLFPKMRWRLAVGLLLLFLLPWLTQAPAYVLGTFRYYYGHKLFITVQPDRAFEDLRGVFWSLGWVIPHSLLLALQALAGVATLAMGMLAMRRRSTPVAQAFVLGFATCYLMLFSPRTETSSYVILAPVVALAAAILFLDRARFVAGWVLVLICVCFFCDAWAYNLTAHWLKPVACAVFVGLMTAELMKPSVRDDIGFDVIPI